MKIPKWILYVLLWMVLGLPGTGMQLAYFQHRFSDSCRANAGFSYGWGLAFGPVGSILAVFLTGFAEHGFQYRCK